MLKLSPMNEAEFDAYLDMAIADYAEEKLKAGNYQADTYLEEGRAEFAQLLPQGLSTQNNHFFTLTNDNDETVGIMWVALRNDQVWVYDIRIDEAYRRRGYASRAFDLLEDFARGKGINKIGLHVFGHNLGARALYEKLGFEITNLVMVKTFDS